MNTCTVENHQSEPKENQTQRLTSYSFFSSMFKVEFPSRPGRLMFTRCLTVNVSCEVIRLGNGLKEDFVKFCFVSLVYLK